jgi:SPP1 gp7 family putative phage head morphogenesis protein
MIDNEMEATIDSVSAPLSEETIKAHEIGTRMDDNGRIKTEPPEPIDPREMLKAREFLNENAKLVLEGSIGDMARELRIAVREGTIKQRTAEEVIFAMTQIVDENAEKKSKLIAATEVQTALSLGKLLQLESRGVQDWVFVTVGDDRVDCQCEKLNGKVFSVRDRRFLPPVHPNCFSADTEVLTRQGFRYFKDLDGSEKFASLNLETKDIEYYPAIEHIDYHYEGEMIHFKHAWFDMMVTPNHDMLIEKSWSRKMGHDKLELVPADKVLSSYRIPRSSKWTGKNRDFMEIDNLKIPMKSFARFMGFWLADGSVTKRSDKWYQIGIVQTKKEGRKYILDELKDFPLDFYETKDRIGKNHVALGEYLRQFGHAPDKFIPQEIKNSTPEIIKEFLDAFIYCDGSVRKEKVKFKDIGEMESRYYFTTSKRMADDLGELILKIGKYPSFAIANKKGTEVQYHNGIYKSNHDLIRISENRTQFATIANMDVERVKYNDKVYCVELPANNTLYVRRNGKCAWSGNCRCSIVPLTSRSGSILTGIKSFIDAEEKKRPGETVKECVKRKIPIIRRENPDMDMDQVVAIAFDICRQRKGEGEYGEEEKPRDDEDCR